MKKRAAGIAVFFGLSFLWASALKADVPKGFAALGSSLPSDWGMLKDLPKLIKEHNLTEFVWEGDLSKERWGTKIEPVDEERGYIVFSRHYLDDIFWFSVPNNKIKKLSLFASQGEYEPVSFAIYPLREIEGLEVSLTDLINEKGGVIKRENLEIRMVRLLPFIKDEKTYRLEPTILERFNKVNLSKEKTVQFWITLYVPKGTPAGLYTGKIKIASPSTQPCEIELSCRVLPIRLEEPDILYGFCFLIPNRSYLYPENLDKYFVDMREHNLNSMATFPDAGVKREGDKIIYDFAQFGFCRQEVNYFSHSLEQIMTSYLKNGFTKPWVCGMGDILRDLIPVQLGYRPLAPEFDQAYVEFIKQLLQKIEEKRWPPFAAFHVVDEPAGHAMDYAKYYYSLVEKHFPQIKTIANVGPWDVPGEKEKDDVILTPYVDILWYNNSSLGGVDRAKKAGKEVWSINQGGWGRDPKLDRYCWGLLNWKVQYKGCFHWVYTWWIEPKVPPFWHPSFVYVVPAPDGPLPTRAWEAVREGIDDIRYLTTLNLLMEKAKTSGKKELIQATEEIQEKIDKILATVPVEWKDREKVSTTPSRDWDLQRWEIARSILKLEGLLSGKE